MSEQKPQIYEFDNFRLNAAERQLLRDGKPLTIPARAFDLLLVLVENNGRLVTKDELYNRVWQDQVIEESNLTVQISAIRKALGETKNNPRFLSTVPGYGYRFTAEVLNPVEDEVLIETETVSRFVVEKEEIKDDEEIEPKVKNVSTPPVFKTRELSGLVSKQRKSSSSYTFLISISLTFLIVIGLAFGWVQYLNARKVSPPFLKTKPSRLTNNGQVGGAHISPDGKYIAYILSDNDGNSLWLRQVGTASDIRVLPPTKADFWGLSFSPDGAFIYYNLFAGDKADVELFRVPSLGGAVEKIPNVIAAGISFSPDGKRIAYIQPDSAANTNYLVIADVDGSNRQIIASKKHPETFNFEHSAEWSPDGKLIACLVEKSDSDGNYSSIVGVNINDKTEIPLSEGRWFDVLSTKWLKNGSGLLVSAKNNPSNPKQVWFLSYPGGEARQITNDLTMYSWLSVTADGKSFSAVQTNTTNSIFIGERENSDGNFREIASEVGELSPLVWTPEGKIAFRSENDGVANLWIMNADGSNRKQLTVNAKLDWRGLCISPNGKYLVFSSWRSGKSNLWRVDADGGSLTQLTNGEADAYPQCSPDNRTVIFQRGIHSKPTLWRVPFEGGEAVQLTDFRGKWAAVSNDGSRISYFYMTEDKWRIGIISSDGRQILQTLDVPAELRESKIVWSSDNRALFYIITTGSVGNIGLLPLDGSPTKQLTNFDAQLISDFSISQDGKNLALARTNTIRDVVLIEGID